MTTCGSLRRRITACKPFTTPIGNQARVGSPGTSGVVAGLLMVTGIGWNAGLEAQPFHPAMLGVTALAVHILPLVALMIFLVRGLAGARKGRGVSIACEVAPKFHRLTAGPICGNDRFVDPESEAVEPMAPPAAVRVWRPTWPGRVATLGFFAMFVMMAIVWLVARAPVWLHLLALLPAAAAVIPLRIAGAKIVLASDCVLVRNPFDVHRVPLDQITSVTNRPRGSVTITTAGGSRIEVWAVPTPMLAWILGRRSRANELMEAIEDAALGRGAPISPSRLRNARGAAGSGPVGAVSRLPDPDRRTAGKTEEASVPILGSIEPAISMTGHAGGRFPRHKWYPGYRVPEVDEFVARIEATLSGGARPERAVTAADVRAVRFPTTRRGGYVQLVVDEDLDRYAGELDRFVP
jgi:hypothetical protein